MSDKNNVLFTQLIFMFHAAAMQHLGKVKNSITDKIERNLVAAQDTIDLLSMLKEKTKGNLTTEEDRFLTELIRELQLNYVDEANKERAGGSKQQESEQKEPEEQKGNTTSSAERAEPKGAEKREKE